MSDKKPSKRHAKAILAGQLDMFEPRKIEAPSKSDTPPKKRERKPHSAPRAARLSSGEDKNERKPAAFKQDVSVGLNIEPAAKADKSPSNAVARNMDYDDDAPILLDTRSAARRVGLGASTLEKMRCQGRGPRFVKLTNSSVRYIPEELDAWVASRLRLSTNETR